MSDDQQAGPEWIFAQQKQRDKAQIWWIIGFVIFALLIIGTLLFFLIPRGDDTSPAPIHPPTATPTPSPTSTQTSTPAPTSPSTTSPIDEPLLTQPPVPDPDLETFAAQVQPRLDDAVHGLDLVTQNLDLGAQIVDSLQQDATILSDTAAPSSIAEDWNKAVTQYATKLADLRGTYSNGANPQPALDAATAALQKVRALVHL
ncbi:hypothetical protein [Microbacterium sp.]|uniref:hypothetical protein n=1 Tax=Microbacterium sp. TaxID=51671 RepID=UPI003A8D9C34